MEAYEFDYCKALTVRSDAAPRKYAVCLSIDDGSHIEPFYASTFLISSSGALTIFHKGHEPDKPVASFAHGTWLWVCEAQ